MLCPSKGPLNIDVHTNTSVPIVCIALANCHVPFVITAKQALEARTISELSMSVSDCLPTPLIRGWIEFPHSLTRWKKTNSPWIKPQVLEINLETSYFRKRFLLSISWYKGACGGKEHPEVQPSAAHPQREDVIGISSFLIFPHWFLTDMRTWFEEIWGHDRCLSLFVFSFRSLN